MFSHTSQPCTFERDCEVVMIPQGDEVTIPAGTVGYITQALGGSFTVFVDGNLFRVAGIDADQMKTVYDPEIPVNIVDLGLIYRCEMTNDDHGGRIIDVEMTLTAPGCGMGDILVDDVRSVRIAALGSLVGVPKNLLSKRCYHKPTSTPKWVWLE